MKSFLRRVLVRYKWKLPPRKSNVWDSDEIIRAELFSAERLEQHAASLARAHSITRQPPFRRSLNARLTDNESVLLSAYRSIAAAVGEGRVITPAAEWLIDNYHLVEEQIRQVKSALPPSFYRQLPKLADGPFVGYPRVFEIAWACIAHSDSRFDLEMLRRFVRAYQQVQPLTIGELWAVAITMRIVLVENLRRAAQHIVSNRIAREAADEVADRLLGVNGFAADPEALVLRYADDGAFSGAFVAQVVKRLRDQDPQVMPALVWLEQHLVDLGTTSDEVVRDEHQRQGASNVTVRNIITSMRLISDVNWADFLEDTSPLDEVLRASSEFASMDFATRNLYRSVIEELACGSSRSELEITRAVVAATREPDVPGVSTGRHRDPGYHLIAAGRPAFERRVGYRSPLRQWPRRCSDALGPAGYIGAVVLVTVLVLAVPLLVLQNQGVPGWYIVLLGLLGQFPATDLAVALVNQVITRGFGATILPGLELREGVPAHLRTIVVVPTILTTPESIADHVERLEVHYLGSSHGETYFALLTDWPDAASASIEGDAEQLAMAAAGIARLNRVHGPAPDGKRFYLLHRRRVWSDSEQRWMGWERKRGKLHELNQLLRGATDTTFVDIDGVPPASPRDVRYVITLDADTRMPRETVQRLVGKLAHPLNQPRFDAATRRVVEGYAVLQPRVTPSLPVGREGSVFQRVFSNMTGIDPYDAAAADVYQDLYGEGSYAGKGIYDVDAFEAALDGRVADGTLLSHDLFEGTFARSGLASDIEFVEEFPSRYDVAAARNQRWARGDWQLLPWLVGRGRAVRHGSRSLPLIGRWKMLDNLRRTLSAPAIVLSLLASWLLPLSAGMVWMAFVLSTIALPALLPVFAAIVPRRPGLIASSHLRALGWDARLAILQIILLITFLAHQTWMMADAIGRTLYRLLVSRRHLLEWVTAAQTQMESRQDLASVYWRMSASVVAGLATIGLLAWVGGDAVWVALPFAVLWISAPAIAWQVSISPLVAGRQPVSETDERALRLVARRTWRFFETFVTAVDHMLPPDNFQEDPQPVLAHRTSPTNLGLYLLCSVSARDFGWIGTVDAIARLEATLATMQRLERFRGHFYNWYDTRDLRPLEPRYVSTVDSGNLAAHLVAVANTCSEWTDVSVATTVPVAGIEDAIELMRDALQDMPDDRRTETGLRQDLEDALDSLAEQFRGPVPAATDPVARTRAIAAQAAKLTDRARALANEYAAVRADDAHEEMLYWAEATRSSIDAWRREVTHTDGARFALNERLAVIGAAARAMALAMEFDFLLDPERKLLSIGYSVGERNLDSSCYDLLASEARLASFFAIAKNDAPSRHWFRLGRAVTPIGLGAALISWSGSMFEYLMPSLVMRAPDGSLLEQTNRLIVRRQIDYGESRDVPWGVSESAYNARDFELTYQYSNFGVPGLGLKRGLSENVVIAPYATGLAAMVDPQAAVINFKRLEAVGARGRYGFYEALDYTPSRLPKGVSVVVVRAYMAHHQGMTVVAIANLLFDGRMRARFHAEAAVQATELLLQERTPRDVSIAHPRAEEVKTAARISNVQLPDLRRLRTPHGAVPQAQLLSNGRYAVMLTSAGSGYSLWGALAITRWREDTTRDDFGSYLYLRDVESGRVWSAGYQPSGVEPDSYEVTFTADRAEYIRIDGEITTTLQVIVSPEDDAEVRRLSIANSGDSARYIDVTSYSELVLAPPAADMAHPAFSKLFVQTEYVPQVGVLLATRRRRSPGEPEIWAAHHGVVEGEVLRDAEFETDRARFLGRGREVQEPIGVMDGRPLSNTTGTVLDAVFALRYRVRIPPNSAVRIAFWTEVAASREDVLDLCDRHRDPNAFVRAVTLAWTEAQVQLRHLGMTTEEANLFQRLAGHVLYADPSMRPSSEIIRGGSGERAVLWAHAISGDIPIVLLRVHDVEDMAIVRQLLRAQEYWRLKQLAVDLVILNERATSYVNDLQNDLDAAVRVSQSRQHIGIDEQGEPRAGPAGARGSVFLLRTDLIVPEARAVLSSVARVVLVGQRGSLADQLGRRAYASGETASAPPRKPPGGAPLRRLPAGSTVPAIEGAEPEFFNGLGGFAADGREYVTSLEAGQSTPAPWINVVANPHFGFQVATEGGGFTWSVNSREHQLTPWSNDPVTDRPGEVLYVRDEETGDLWGPTAAPVRHEGAPYIARHGQGYSRFEHTAHDVELDLVVYVPLDDPVKICRLKLRNLAHRKRRLSVTAYVEWVLGTTRAASAPFIVTSIDAKTGAIFARNPWSTVFSSRVAFADLGGRQSQWTGDRREFLGRHGRLDRPAALGRRAPLSGLTGAGLDPCGALRTLLELEPDETQEIVFFLGDAESAAAAQSLLARYRAKNLDEVLAAVQEHWDEVLGTVQVRTPDRSLDVMLNRWMLYQTLVCRIWARSAFYQASGAYGFRDQLQDGMALVLARPAFTREHLLRAAGRQFREGDVQHWWLPPLGQGVRTRISDDRIWLAYAAAHYLETTGDLAILDVAVPFIEGARLAPQEHDLFFQPAVAEEKASFFEHCARGLDASLELGVHGLPLIGTGDWNDGMNRVGEQGRGESVWLGWFLHTTLSAFAPVASARGELARAARWRAHAVQLAESLDRNAWDGEWYRRGYFDDGTAFGSAANDECRIDSIAQSWSVIAAAADAGRASRAMAAVDQHLIRWQDGLALLFTPPFDKTPLEPGYVKGYPPGLRENGGQYTHAAAWTVVAFARLGLGDKATELFAMLNPVNRTSSRTGVRIYKVEPYAVAADIYSVAPHAGRGGWTWYTGSAGWMYRAGLESILGFQKRGNHLLVQPCIPTHWRGFEIDFRHASSRYEIKVENPNGVNRGVVRIVLDGTTLPDGTTRVPLVDDGATHQVHVTLG